MKQEEKHEYSGEYDENNDLNSSSHKRYYESISEKRSSSPERSRKRSRRDRSSSSSSRSRSPDNYKRIRYYGTRENPNKSRVLGVFGLSNKTLEHDLKELFSSYGPVEHASIVYDSKTRKSRGFGFIYFRYIDDASKARRDCNGMKLDGRTIRVDYSITKRAHTPTPGIYMGIRQSRNDVRSYYGSRSSYRRFSRYSSRRSRSYSR